MAPKAFHSLRRLRPDMNLLMLVAVLGAMAIQAAMLALKLESWEEARVILVFHVVGTIMELFKTSAGSWIYPEPSLLRIGEVPLFSGFMYAAVGSYIARVWRIFHFCFEGQPSALVAAALAACIYINFFAHHWLPDIRIGLFAATAVLFWRTSVRFTTYRTQRVMPLPLGWARSPRWSSSRRATRRTSWTGRCSCCVRSALTR